MSTDVQTLQERYSDRNDSCFICAGQLKISFPFGDKPRVVRCRVCGTESLRPLPKPADLKEHYRDYSLTKKSDDQILFLASLGVETLKFYLGNTELANKAQGDIRFLDVGFGNGAGLFAGSMLGFQSYGVDLNSVSVSNATNLARKHGFKVTCVEGTVATLAEQPARFDLVKASQILEHVLDPLRFISEISALQPKGGYLIIECPNNDAAFWLLKNRTRRMFGRLNYYNSLKLEEHLWGFNKNSLPLLLMRGGYRTLMVRDYAAGNAIFEPESVLWYPTLASGFRYTIRNRTWGALMYAGVRAFDSIASGLFRKGTGLAVLCQKQDSAH
jgi:2-polyprenyl-3-methyl-5-hydroxy-6-metoxy-1,4-benzoquinol methylase